jgi:hypothetical protein
VSVLVQGLLSLSQCPADGTSPNRCVPRRPADSVCVYFLRWGVPEYCFEGVVSAADCAHGAGGVDGDDGAQAGPGGRALPAAAVREQPGDQGLRLRLSSAPASVLSRILSLKISPRQWGQRQLRQLRLRRTPTGRVYIARRQPRRESDRTCPSLTRPDECTTLPSTSQLHRKG